MAAKNASGFLKTLLLTFLTCPNGQGDNDLLREGDPTHPIVVKECSNCDWMWCKEMEKSSWHYED